MTNNEKTLLNLIREHEDPAAALIVALSIISATAEQLQSSSKPSPAVQAESA